MGKITEYPLITELGDTDSFFVNYQGTLKQIAKGDLNLNEPFAVTISSVESGSSYEYQSDKTAVEIAQAYKDGKSIYLIWTGSRCYFNDVYEDDTVTEAYFNRVWYNMLQSVTISTTSDGTTTIKSETITLKDISGDELHTDDKTIVGSINEIYDNINGAERVIYVEGTEASPILLSTLVDGGLYAIKGYVAYDDAHKTNTKRLYSAYEKFLVTIRKGSSYVNVVGDFGTLTSNNDGTFSTSYFCKSLDVATHTGIDNYNNIVLESDISSITWCNGIYVTSSIKRKASDTEPDSHYGKCCYLYPMSNPDTATTFNFLVIPSGYSNKADEPFIATYNPSNTVATTADTYPFDSVEFYQTKPKATTISLPSSGWTGSGLLYQQTVSVPIVTANSQVDLRPSPDQLQELLTAEISLTAANESGSVTVFAIGGKPTSDYSMQIIVSEVDVV